MLYTGPWHDAIVHLANPERVAVAKRIAGEDTDAPAAVGQARAGRSDPAQQLSAAAPGLGDWIGVCCEGETRAVLAYGPAFERRVRRAGSAGIVEAAIWVDPRWRRQGMAQALLQRCIAINRQTGVRCLVIEGLETDEALRKLLRRYAAGLAFARGACQAWLELGPAAAPIESPVFAR
jgi:GNAT superfamily N-acetyltransferase